MRPETIRVAVEGRGGQGVLTLGQLLGATLGTLYEHVTVSPSYTAEMFGGPCYCYMVASQRPIHDPIPRQVELGLDLHGVPGDVLSRTVGPACALITANVNRVNRSVNYMARYDGAAREVLKVARTSDIPMNIYLYIVAARYLDLPMQTIRQAITQHFSAEHARTYLDVLDGAQVDL